MPTKPIEQIKRTLLKGHPLTMGPALNGEHQKTNWTIGLINASLGKYLTAESFGFKVNANGVALKKKQLWTLEAYGEDEAICLRSNLGRYLAVDQFGNVTCDSEDKDIGAKFTISMTGDAKGQWALKNENRGYFLGASGDQLICNTKAPSSAELWTVHLAARPQVTIKSVGRRRFARLSEAQDEIQVDATTPWGENTLFTLEFRDGKYAVHTGNNKYLSPDGKLLAKCEACCLFAVEFHGGFLALKDANMGYLSPTGSRAVIRSRSNTVTRDELFSLEDSVPQASFVAALNGKFVSVKQGVDLTANQDEISDHETFQLEFDKATQRWLIRTMQDKYWTLEPTGGIQASGERASSNALFRLDWQTDGSVSFIANNGKLLAIKKSGHLYANADSAQDENVKFYFFLISRPMLVLKCDQGFVGFKSNSSAKLECNKGSYETILVERGEKGVVYFKGTSDAYWSVADDGSITVDSESRSEGFTFELREPSRLAIKLASTGCYVIAEKNGLFKVGGPDPAKATLWEY
ncbi:protein singed-like isoform X3 [Varroa jacobsoni]|uniref:protein singed-like isoform X3 n=1 Tax=Varroa jacobsoni TaxID=62625 RepID=UPI000BF76D6D|nr:protein singed-like isoform X3 [Varroa jacobsoni]